MDHTQTKRRRRNTAHRRKPASRLGNSTLDWFRQSIPANVLLSLFIPLIYIFTMEWIARGTLFEAGKNGSFFQAFGNHPASFVLAGLLLVFLYIFISQLSGWHALATVLVGLVANVPAVVTYYKLTMRGEPFLPWDIFQIKDLMGVSSSLSFSFPLPIIITPFIILGLALLASRFHLPQNKDKKSGLIYRFSAALLGLGGGLLLLFGIFLNPTGSYMAGIHPDMWMQDRYYRTHGVLTGFLTNIQVLNISVPEGYSGEKALGLARRTEQNAVNAGGGLDHAAFAVGEEEVQQPDIIYVMAESFWDVTSLPGVTYDQPLLDNLQRLSQQGASGLLYTPSFGGGTCDVEFEALTGFSMEHLPAGSKPFQQYVTGNTFSLPNYLKSTGYETLAIHGYGRTFWNRDSAYPRLGIDTFIASDDFVDPVKKRGFISDDAMVDRIIEEHQKRANEDTPVFIHAVTMQNHTTYNRDKYPEEELVNVTGAPDAVPDATIGQLEDCATGIRDMDAALGKLADYLQTCERPTILVFWGDHLNPMSDGFNLFTDTGFIEEGSSADPKMHETPLLIWSNYATTQVDLGIVAAYNLSPVASELYGLDRPVFFDYLLQQLDTLRVRTRGITVSPDGSYSEELTDAQQESVLGHSILQYDYLFGDGVLESYTPKED